MSSTELLDGIPYWTEKMYRPGGGQDHLGLGSVVTDQILPRLSPGINVLTIHPRYWSFYAFVLSEFWERDLPRTRTALRDWYRPLECIYSVACSLCENPDHYGSPIGTRRVRGVVDAQPDGFDPQFDYMDSAMGGYGLYYATVMQAIDLVRLADAQLGLPVDAVTPEGQVVAGAFRSVIADTEYYRDWIDRHDEEVPYEVVAEYGELACFCRLRDDSALDRPLLVDAFLHHGSPVEAEARRHTLRMFCELADQSESSPVDAASFRRLVYYGADYAAEGSDAGARFVPPTSLVRTARKWRLYQAREYFNAAINEMWRRLSYWGHARDGGIYPVPRADLIASIGEIDFDGFAESIGVNLPPGGLTAKTPYRDLLEWVVAAGSVTGQIDDRWNLDCDLTEDRIIEWLGYGRQVTDHGPEMLAAALTLATLVAARLWPPELGLAEPTDWFPVLAGGQDRLGLQRFIDALRARIDANETIGDITRWLTFEYVIAQHERVATAKLPTTGDTFRFRPEAGRLRFFPKDARVGMNDSRFNALATVVHELGWSGYLYAEHHGLTEEGDRMRVDGDLPTSGAFEPLVAAGSP